MKRTFVAGVAFVALVAAGIGVGADPAAGQQGGAGRRSAFTAGRYIVTFADDAVATYEGYVAGYPATRPRAGQKLDPGSPAARRWQQRLVDSHDAALARVGAAKLYDYTIASNGLTADLSGGQAASLSKLPGVVSLARDTMAEPTTTESPRFLGLDAPGGLWSQLSGPKNAGAGVVVGVLDTGIWPESPAFAGNTGIPVPPDWRGQCVTGEQFNRKSCNDKLIGARFYVKGFGKRYVSTDDYVSPRDGNGHGSHTASTAAGNNGTTITIDGKLIGTGSGMAPGAKVAMYKVCWEGRKDFGAGCFSSDAVAAIDDAVADGVDVINYSIGGGGESDVLDPVAQAFRGASNAGVFVANSAGNSGPGESTFDHPAPWVTTVAAATFRRAFQALELESGARFVGASTTPSLPVATPLVTAAASKLDGAPAEDAARCFDGTLDPSKVAGKVVVCERGVNARIDKSFEVMRAGGVGMVLVNVGPNSLNGDYHPVPSVHVDDVAGAAIATYITAAGPAATARIVPLTAAELAAAPQVPEITDFSSRGPSTTTDGNILKPDIAAPGNDVVAAVAPPSNHGRDWDFMSGTSMSSPHIAGIGALLRAKYPSWLPSEIKSAMMTSATDTVSSADDPFAQGAGFVNPNGAADPGLVYPTTADEYRQYLVSVGVQFAPPFDTLTPVSATDLNEASIAIGKLAGVQSVTRRVKNVGASAATYTPTVGLPGFDATVSPSSLTLSPGQEATFTVGLARTDAPLGEWAKGSLTWSDGSHRVRIPIAVKPVGVAAPTDLRMPAAEDGSVTFEVTPGYTGTLDSEIAGLVGVTPILESVATGAFDAENPVADDATDRFTVTVPAGTAVARFALDAEDDTGDLDLYVYKDGELVDLSASGAADEEVTLVAPAEGAYDVYVNGFSTPGGATTYALSNFVVPAVDAGNATAAPDPAAVTTGTPVALTVSWAGLDPTKRWFGMLSFAGTDTVTFLTVG